MQDCFVTNLRRLYTSDLELEDSSMQLQRESALNQLIEYVTLGALDAIHLADNMNRALESLRNEKARLACSLGLSGFYTGVVMDFMEFCLEFVVRETDGMKFFTEEVNDLSRKTEEIQSKKEDSK